MTSPVRAMPFVTQIAAAGSRQSPARHHQVDGPERQSGRNASPSGITPSNIMSPAPEPTRGSWTEVRLGARAHITRTVNHARASPARSSSDRKIAFRVRSPGGSRGLGQLFKDDVVAEGLELGDEPFCDAFGVAFAVVVASEVVVDLAG